MSPKDPAIPSGADEIGADWLTRRLRDAGVADGVIAEIETESVGVGIGLIGALTRLTLTWTDGTGPASVVAKCPTADEGGRFVALVLGMYRNEVGFYDDLAPRAPIAIPECFHAAHDPETDDFVILMEDLGSWRVVDQLEDPSDDDLAAAVDGLADLHAAFWEDRSLLEVEWLRALGDAPFPDAIAMAFTAGWEVVRDIYADELTPAVTAFGERYVEALPGMVARLSAQPWTLSHGDYRVDNLVFDTSGGLAVCDWQLVDRSRGARDLAYLLSQSVSPPRRAAVEVGLIERYVSRLAQRGVDYPSDVVWDDYRLATAFALVYGVVAAGDIDLGDDRARALTRAMVARSVTAIEDLDALDVL